MKRTTTRSSLAAATAAACALAFAPAVPTLDAPPAERHVQLDGVHSAVADTALALDADGRVDREALVGALGGLTADANRLDARAHRDALRTMLRDAGGTPFTGEACVDGCDEPMEPGEEPESWEFSYVDVYGAGDVDGDGYEDLAEATVSFGYDAEADEFHESTDVQLRDGRDGQTLWSALDVPGFLGAVPDVDGDGLADLIAISGQYEFVSDWSCDDDGCSDSFELRISRSLQLLRGVDGAGLGATTIDSASGYSYSDSSSSTGPVYDDSYSDSYFDENMLTELDFVDGGHGHQLLLGTFSMQGSYDQRRRGVDAFVESPGVREVEASLATDSLVRLMDPTSGEETVLLDSAEDGHISIPLAFHGAATDAVLVTRFDGAASGGHATCVEAVLSVCPASEGFEEQEPTAPSVALVDLDGSMRWETELGFESVGAVPAGGDIDGDGLSDVLDLAYDEESGDDVVVLRSGADGAEIWTSAFVYGQASGDGLVGLDATFGEDGYDLDAVAVDGATGEIRERALLASESYEDSADGEEDSFTETALFIDFWALSDGDADLLVERAVIEYVLVDEECYTEIDEGTGEEYESCWFYYEGQVVDGDVSGRDGRDLTQLFAYDLQRQQLVGVVDVDGDLDMELVISEAYDENATYEHSLRRLDGTVLWAVSGDTWLRGPVAVPHGADLLAQRYVEDAESVTIVDEVLDGRTGVVRLEVRRESFGVGEGEDTAVVVSQGMG